MTKTLEQQRQEQIKTWQREYREQLKSCMDEIHERELENPMAKKCVIRRWRTSKEFKIALSHACQEDGMVAIFGWFGKIEVWFNDWEYKAARMSP